jgi:hypothetical protein
LVSGFYRVDGFYCLFALEEFFWICSIKQVKGYLKGYTFIA